MKVEVAENGSVVLTFDPATISRVELMVERGGSVHVSENRLGHDGECLDSGEPADDAVGGEDEEKISPGRCIVQMREAQGWSQEQLAENADVHKATIGRIEGGQTVPHAGTRDKIARALGVDVPTIWPLGCGVKRSRCCTLSLDVRVHLRSD